MHICRKRLKMKPYEEIILSYIHKYHEINLEQLQYEIGLNISLTQFHQNHYHKHLHLMITTLLGNMTQPVRNGIM